MNNYENEQLSALVDDELDVEQASIFNKLINDDETKDTWSRYHLIGDCLRDHVPEKISSQVATRVANTLRNEPTILAPRTTKRFNIKPIAGFAIAASVAMLAVFGVQRSNEVNTSSDVPTIAANQVNSSNAQPQSFSFPEVQVLPAAVRKSDTPESVANQRLNNYLMNHNEYRSNGGMNGILPYVRIVTFESQDQ